MTTIPRIVSADDHVVEPPDVFTSRLPAKYREVGPRVGARAGRGDDVPRRQYVTRMGTSGDDGPLADFWLYEDLQWPHTRLGACAGFAPEDVQVVPMIYDEMRPGLLPARSAARRHGPQLGRGLAVLPDLPAVLRADVPRGATTRTSRSCACGRTTTGWSRSGAPARADDSCRCASSRSGIPRSRPTRSVATRRGVCGPSASPSCPRNLGLPSVHDADRHWDPFVAACAETGTVICMHSGSGSKMPSTSPDAPPAVSSTLTHELAEGSLADWLFSGLLVRHPDVTLTYSEGQIGWIPYILARADRVWEHNRGWGDVARPRARAAEHLLLGPRLRMLLRRRGRPRRARRHRSPTR